MNAMLVAPQGAFWTEPNAVREDGFVALDACHRRMLETGLALEALIDAAERGFSPAVRASAAAIAAFFGMTAAEHHEHEERHVFPALIASGNPDMVRAVMHLQEDHDRLEERWMELEPHVLAIAGGYGIQLDALREGVRSFTALHRQHIRLEEALAYPVARRELGREGCRAMGRDILERELAQRD